LSAKCAVMSISVIVVVMMVRTRGFLLVTKRRVGAVAEQLANGWTIHQASMSRSARILMDGTVRVPQRR
ncbi:MAG: PrpF domain-containing protein, partial [Pseudomonadota bacterium]|nr:PrpF domain-containing protein [Pseudomonadota bacterium]